MAVDSQPSNPDLLADGLVCGALVGPTASGKSRLAIAIAERSGAEIVSLDSMQVYRGMDVGTAKPTASEQARVRHHMLDLVAPNERYDVTRYLSDLAPVLADLRSRGVPVLFTGGTAFWLKALLSGIFAGPPADLDLRARVEARVRDIGNARAHRELAGVDPRSAARIHANDTKRLVRALEVFEQTGRPLSDWQKQWGWHALPAREPARPTQDPARPTHDPARPAHDPARPAHDPARPTHDPARTAHDPARTAHDPARATHDPARPAREPVRPAREPVQPACEPVRPTCEPVRPTHDPAREPGRLARERERAFPIVGLEVERAELALRIAARARAMLDAGWAEEAAAIRDGPGFGPTSIQALGYREVLALHDGEVAREECAARITQRTRQFARRQATWYRKLSVSWIDGGSGDDAEGAVAERVSSAVRTLRFPGSPGSSG